MIDSPARPTTLATALAVREADVRAAWRVGARARAARRAGDTQLADWYLKMLRTRVMCVRLANTTVKFVAERLNLCGCAAGQRCVCAPPF